MKGEAQQGPKHSAVGDLIYGLKAGAGASLPLTTGTELARPSLPVSGAVCLGLGLCLARQVSILTYPSLSLTLSLSLLISLCLFRFFFSNT